MRSSRAAIVAAGLAMALAACSRLGQPSTPVLAGGDALRGRAAISRFGCGSCHTIAGISGAQGLVGPPLTGIGSRMYVGGVLANTPRNMVRWIRNPHDVDAKAAMPVLGVNGQDATDIATYLYTTK